MIEDILIWLRSHECVSVSVDTVEDISDGIAMYEVLAEINSEFFDKSLLKYNARENSRLKIINLRRLFDHLSTFYLEDFNTSIDDIDIPDLQRISDDHDEEEIIKLAKFVLAAGMFSANRAAFIQNIMGLEQAVQNSIMSMTKDVLTLYPSLNDPEHQRRRSSGDVSKTSLYDTEYGESNDNFASNGEVEALQTSLENCQEENDRLRNEAQTMAETIERLSKEVQETNAMDAHTIPGKAIYAVRLELNRTKDELEQYELDNENLRKEVTNANETNRMLQREMEDLDRKATSAQEWKDRANYLEHNEDKVKKLETQLNTYQQKFLEMQDMKSQLLSLEQENQNLLSEKTHYMEKLKKVQMSKNITSESGPESPLNNSPDTANLQIALTAANDKVESLESACQRHLTHIHELELKIEDMEFNDEGMSLPQNHSSNSLSSIGNSLSPQPTSDPSLAIKLQGEISKLKKRNEELERDLKNNNAGANDQMMKFQEQLTMIAEKNSSGTSKETEYLEKMNKLLEEKSQLESDNLELIAQKEKLTGDLVDSRTRLQHELEQGVSTQYKDKVLNLQNAVLEKENEIIRLKNISDKERKSIQFEQRLFTTHIYDYGAQILKNSAKDRLQGRGQSLLNVQRRQASQRFYKNMS